MKNKLSGAASIRLGLAAFIATGGGLIVSTIRHEDSFYKIEILLIFGIFFSISLVEYFQKLRHVLPKIAFSWNSLSILGYALAGGTLTWFLNHEMGYGPVVANGLIGVIAASLLPNPLAGIAYTSSFVGMSSLAVLPSLGSAALGSLIVGIVIQVTAEIYAGLGGKGGTTAALSTLITRTILRIFG